MRPAPTFAPFAALLALSLLACGTTAASAQESSDGEVTLTVLLYSGRPNPTVTLDEAAVRRLGELLAEAPTAEGYDRATVLPSILGYNGILVENPAGRQGLPRRLAVYGDAAELAGPGGDKRFVRDQDGAIESFLLAVAERTDTLDDGEQKVIREARRGESEL